MAIDEEQAAALVRAAAGGPPPVLDADTLIARARPARRPWRSALVAAALVAAVAGGLVWSRSSGDAGAPAAGPAGQAASTPHVAGGSASDDPEQAAIRQVDAVLATLPVLPGAVELDHAPAGLTEPFMTTGGPDRIDHARWWTAPGTLDDAAAWFTDHPPTGYASDGSGGGGGPGGPTVETVDFAADGRPDIEFAIVPHGSGVAVRADVELDWVPLRPAWSLVGTDVTSIDVTIVRKAYDHGRGGAPTVTRTLTGAAARRLAQGLDRLASAAPEGAHSCPAQLVQEDDRVVVHRPSGDLTFDRSGGGCAFTATVRAPGHPAASLVGNDFTATVLSELGLPADYGQA
ncbi:MAG: hypothetical protein ACTHMS_06015 [Jatrophihabitans sp.]|uniref:hypothetical protein n=1 Tax=Jatrophihabitans sp. TaxID=1932789 RepID=UPI003F7FDB47